MKKLKIIIPICFLVTFFASSYLVQNWRIGNVIKNYWFPPKGKTINNYKIVRCNYSLLEPQMVFISDQKILNQYPELALYFSSFKNSLFGKIKENYLGVTTVTNTTFPELVKMVKKDCSQFQESHIDLTGYENYNELPYDEQRKIWPEINSKNLGWTYTPYKPEPKEPELTEEEKIQQETLEEKMRQETIERRAKRVPIENLYK